MYALAKALTLRQLLLEQLPACVGALVIAELFYKFHSFTLEAIAFLATWFLLDAVTGRLVGAIGSRKRRS